MAFENRTTDQLKKRNKILLGLALAMLALMIVVLIYTIVQMSEGNENKMLPFLVPVVLGPLAFIPLLFSSKISTELRKRKAAADQDG